MAKYKIYAGLGGSLGGATYVGTYEYENEKDAVADAYQIAVEEYQSYEGLYGIASYEDIREEMIENGEEDDEDIIQEAYEEEMANWIEYYAKLVEE